MRTHQINLRMSEAELARSRSLAHDAGLSPTAFIRMLIKLEHNRVTDASGLPPPDRETLRRGRNADAAELSSD